MINPIQAYFHGGSRVARTRPVYQYNEGMVLQFIGIDLPDSYRVDFANSVTGESKPAIGTPEGVIIPYEYFIPGATIYAWVV